MSRLRVHGFSISIDGYGAGRDQNVDNPLGVRGLALHDWIVSTRTFQRMQGFAGGAEGVDDDFMARGFANIGAWILGRNMFGPIRGPWPDDTWRGWWGSERGTTFHFVSDGIEAALRRATEAADGQDVRLGGGVATIRQYVRAGLVDEMHVAISPVLLGSGEHLFAGFDLPEMGYQCSEHLTSANAMHVVFTRRR